jgi:hypothetical protein
LSRVNEALKTLDDSVKATRKTQADVCRALAA